MSGLSAAIVGPGNIGTDLLIKLLRGDRIRVHSMVGVDPESEGPARARKLGSGRSTSPPAAIGPFVCPPVNLDEPADAPDLNMITCGGQATIPIVAAVAAVGGALLMLWVDVAARVVVRPQEIPMSVVTGLVGAPIFLLLLGRRHYTHSGGGA